jgi:hypothetical protein
MPLVPAICTQCGARIDVDSSKDAAICKFCGTPFIVEKAVNQYRINAKNVFILGESSTDFEIVAGTLKNYKGSSPNVSVPPEAKNLQCGIFNSMRALESVSLPSSVTTVESIVFTKCSNLKSVKLPDSITEIGDRCFDECVSLQSIDWPKRCKTIKLRTFSGCSKLSSITLHSGLEKIQSEAFLGCESLKRIEIPDTVAELGENVFKNCKSLESVKLPAGLKTIPFGCFWGCESLKSIELPRSLKAIHTMAFAYSGLESVALYGDVMVNPEAFLSCASLRNVHLSRGVDLDPEYELHKFDDYGRLSRAPFRDCESLKNVHWDKWVKKVDFYFFDPGVRINKRGIPFF